MADRRHHIEVRRRAVLRALEVHEMQPASAVRLDAPGRRHRVLTVHRHLLVVALQEPYHLMVI